MLGESVCLHASYEREASFLMAFAVGGRRTAVCKESCDACFLLSMLEGLWVYAWCVIAG